MLLIRHSDCIRTRLLLWFMFCRLTISILICFFFFVCLFILFFIMIHIYFILNTVVVLFFSFFVNFVLEYCFNLLFMVIIHEFSFHFHVMSFVFYVQLLSFSFWRFFLHVLFVVRVNFIVYVLCLPKLLLLFLSLYWFSFYQITASTSCATDIVFFFFFNLPFVHSYACDSVGIGLLLKYTFLCWEVQVTNISSAHFLYDSF